MQIIQHEQDFGIVSMPAESGTSIDLKRDTIFEIQ